MDSPSDATLDALYLSALRWEDAELEHVADALPAGWLEAARRRRAALSNLDAGAKARALRRMAAPLSRPLESSAALPPRALALLCAEVARETGRRWAAQAPPPRPGFVAAQGLRAWLRRLATRSQP